MEQLIRPQSEFPLLARYKKVFPAIDQHTIFAYDRNIYADDYLPDHLVVHEKVHLRQQKEIGLDLWVDQFLSDPQFRLKQEIEAYKAQLSSIKDRNSRQKIRVQSAKALSSPMYGNIITFNWALDALK